MATFPAIPPVHPAPKRTSAPSGFLVFGDGYERSARFGLNAVRPEWQLTWEVSSSDTNTIEAFLQAQCDAGDSFDWQPPDAATPLRWRCDEWSTEQIAHNWFRVSASFRRAFELTVPASLVAAATTCDDDKLCEFDLGLPCRALLGNPISGTVSPTGTTTFIYDEVINPYKIVGGFGSCSSTVYLFPSNGDSVTVTGGVGSIVFYNYQGPGVGWAPAVRSGTCGGYGNGIEFRIYKPNGEQSTSLLYGQDGGGDYLSFYFVNLRAVSTEPDAVDAATYFGNCTGTSPA